MTTVFIVMEKSPNGTRVSKVFENHLDAIRYRIECIGDHEIYDFDSAYQYFVEEWGVVGVNPLKSMTRRISHYQLAYWMEAASPSDWVLQKSGVVFTNRDEAVAYLERVMDEHRIAGFSYDYYKVFEYLKEV